MSESLELHIMEANVLDWLNQANDQGNIKFHIFADQVPSPHHQKKFDQWWKKEFLKIRELSFFLALRAASPRPLKLDVQSITVMGEDFEEVVFRCSLPELLNLPNINPQEELKIMKHFFLRVQEVVRQSGQDYPRLPHLEWYRSGYGKDNKGLALVGFNDPSQKKMFDQEIIEFRKNSCFEYWYQANLEALKRIRLGPHIGFALPFVENKMYWQDEFRKKWATLP